MADKSYICHSRNFIALTGSSNTLKEHDNISPDHSLYSFPIKFGQTFKNFIGNFTVANKVETQVARKEQKIDHFIPVVSFWY